MSKLDKKEATFKMIGTLLEILFKKICLFLLCVCGCSATRMSMHHMCTIPMESSRDHYILWNWSRQLVIGLCVVLGTKLRSSAREVGSLNNC